jgi:CheY-like chemotaxis protein
VDDQEDTLSLFAFALESAGANVRTATCAAEAIKEATERPPDVLVSDLGLPGTDGCDLLRQLREMGRDRKQFPAIAVSAYARREDRAKAVAAGFQLHLAKPLDPAALVEVLATIR